MPFDGEMLYGLMVHMNAGCGWISTYSEMLYSAILKTTKELKLTMVTLGRLQNTSNAPKVS